MEKKRDSFFLQNKKPKKYEKKDNKEQSSKEEYNNKKDNYNKQVKARQQQFDEDRDAKEKKLFDKKTYRLKKYSKKYKLEQWEEQRKKKLLRTYYKEIENDPAAGTYKPVSFDEDTPDGNEFIGRYVKHPDLIKQETAHKEKKRDPYHKAKAEYKKIKQDKLEKKVEMQKAKEERNQKLQEYKKKKQDRFKKLSKKNKKGQPMMKGSFENYAIKRSTGRVRRLFPCRARVRVSGSALSLLAPRAQRRPALAPCEGPLTPHHCTHLTLVD
ncbi:hypothetical protein K1T71_012957 [Dendrolimus kikuchii]|uniref:Uncharacterized protein n=1 Tax=Dendrolimus kikuchii TaxID=765133 RepID=A0ACC1CIL4_9NEOP|nr:hypothetical protein K1T71_012957 [Dendrolimus kikuchii]